MFAVVAEYLISKYNFKTIKGKKNNVMYVYEDGIFIEKGYEIIETEVEELISTYNRNGFVSEIVKKIEVMRESF